MTGTEASTVTAWRAEILTPNGRHTPHHHDERTLGPVLQATCRLGRHEPPAYGCTCGVYAVPDVRGLLNFARVFEYYLAKEYERAPGEPERQYVANSRVLVARGRLSGAVLAPPTSHEATLAPIWFDHSDLFSVMVTSGLARAPHRAPDLYTVRGDPPGTMRGSRFTMDLAVVRAATADKKSVYRSLLGPDVTLKLVRGDTAESALSSVLERYVSTGSDTAAWWTS